MTVLEAIQKSTEFLGKKNVESPRLQTELLLAHLLKMPRMKLYLNFDRVLSPAETDALREFVKRRGQREPLQHIIGSTSFCGYEIAVNRHALVPRPETELLAELGWQFINRADSNSRHRHAVQTHRLDFCTGSGCIAIALAAKCPRQRSWRRIFRPTRWPWLEKTRLKTTSPNGLNSCRRWICSGLREPRSRQTERGRFLTFDLIISNPPYIPSAEIATLEPEVRDFDRAPAFDGGADGLDFYRRLATGAKPFLKPDGKIMLEFGDGQADAIKKIFEDEKWIVEAVKEDYSQRARILIAQLKISSRIFTENAD